MGKKRREIWDEIATAINEVLRPRFRGAGLTTDGEFACYDDHSDIELWLPSSEVLEHFEEGTLKEYLDEVVAQFSDSEAPTALEYAAIGGYRKVVQLLIEAGDAMASQTYGPLAQAAERGDVEAIRQLLEAEQPSASKKRTSASHLLKALRSAAWKGHSGVVQELLPRVPNPHPAKRPDESALAVAARCGHPEVVRQLVATNPRPVPGVVAAALTGTGVGISKEKEGSKRSEIIDLLAPLAEPEAVTEARSNLASVLEGLSLRKARKAKGKAANKKDPT